MRTARGNELGAFLKACRAQLRPGDVGLPVEGASRRVPGLRREEVAALAAISTDYYTRLEQGRMNASASVLAALARTLRLDEDQRAYLDQLAGRPPARPPRPCLREARPYLRRLLSHLTDTPAMVASRTLDVLAWNPLASALIVDFAAIPATERNFVRLLFTEPSLRERYADWEEVAHSSVAYLRMETADDPHDPRLAPLVGDLCQRDAQFRGWWTGHHVAAKRRGTRTFDHPLVGRVALEWDTLTSDADPDQHVIVYTADPGTPAARALRRLAAGTVA